MVGDLLDTVEIEGIAHPIAEDDGYNGLLMTKTDMNETLQALNNGEAYLADTHGHRVGKVTQGRIDFLGRLRVVMELSAKEYPDLVRKLQDGTYKGLSLGLKHFVDPDTLSVDRKKIIEVSICPEGDLPGTGINAVRRESRSVIENEHAKLDERLDRERRRIPILTTASADSGGISKPYALQQMNFVVKNIGKFKQNNLCYVTNIHVPPTFVMLTYCLQRKNLKNSNKKEKKWTTTT